MVKTKQDSGRIGRTLSCNLCPSPQIGASHTADTNTFNVVPFSLNWAQWVSFCHWNVYLCPSKRLSPSALSRTTDTSTWMLQEHLGRRFQAPEVLPEHMGKNAASNPLFKRTQPKVSGDLCFTHSWQNSQQAKLYKPIYLWGINCITDRKIQLWATALQIIIFHMM